MNNNDIKNIIKINNLKTTVNEFKDYYDNLVLDKITYKINKYKFNELYNGHKIENPFNNDDARYYVIKFNNGIVYLQDIIPFVSGKHMLIDKNIDEISKKHAEQIVSDDLINRKIQKCVEKFK